MKILKVIHGYPPAYNAGSEVYSQTLCHELAKSHDVHVFTREENPFLPDYHMRLEYDPFIPAIKKHIINIPLLRQKDRYIHKEVDIIFEQLLEDIQPDVVHIGHLNHLSISIIEKAKHLPLIFTLHDYWLLCPRGQFIQRNPQHALDMWTVCDGQENKKCAENCYAGYFSGIACQKEEDMRYWAQWVEHRQTQLKYLMNLVDLFIAPSMFLLNRFKESTDVPDSKFMYLDYGFNLSRFITRERHPEKSFVFGYIGTHTPQKGIHLLLNAFSKLKGKCILRIWGRARGEVTPGLKQLVSSFPLDIQERIEWCSEYTNDSITSDVFNHVDTIVVPSIWVENSPLVIHEAQQAGVPVITASVGGMSEFVTHEENGLLFTFRNEESLAQQMQRCIDEPTLTHNLSQKRYIYTANGDIPSIQEHVQKLEVIYHSLIAKKGGIIHEQKTRALAYNV